MSIVFIKNCLILLGCFVQLSIFFPNLINGKEVESPRWTCALRKMGQKGIFFVPFTSPLEPGIHLSTLLDLGKSCCEHRGGGDGERAAGSWERRGAPCPHGSVKPDDSELVASESGPLSWAEEWWGKLRQEESAKWSPEPRQWELSKTPSGPFVGSSEVSDIFHSWTEPLSESL